MNRTKAFFFAALLSGAFWAAVGSFTVQATIGPAHATYHSAERGQHRARPTLATADDDCLLCFVEHHASGLAPRLPVLPARAAPESRLASRDLPAGPAPSLPVATARAPPEPRSARFC